MNNPAADRENRLVIVTGASSGVGLWATKALLDLGCKVVMAVRDTTRAQIAAAALGLSAKNLIPLTLVLSDLNSIREFVKSFRNLNLPLDALVIQWVYAKPSVTSVAEMSFF